jgi:hypothetical protein
MSQPTARGIASAAAVFAGLTVFLWGFQRLLLVGGTPEQRGASTHYRTKPMMRILMWIGTFAGLAAIWSGTSDLRAKRNAPGVILMVVGAIATTGAGIVVLAQPEIIVDPSGIRYRANLFKEKFIAWEDLSHFEQFNNSRALTTNYVIRSKTGTTITAGDSSFDTTDLLRRIEEHHLLEERPYQRKKWYGG